MDDVEFKKLLQGFIKGHVDVAHDLVCKYFLNVDRVVLELVEEYFEFLETKSAGRFDTPELTVMQFIDDKIAFGAVKDGKHRNIDSDLLVRLSDGSIDGLLFTNVEVFALEIQKSGVKGYSFEDRLHDVYIAVQAWSKRSADINAKSNISLYASSCHAHAIALMRRGGDRRYELSADSPKTDYRIALDGWDGEPIYGSYAAFYNNAAALPKASALMRVWKASDPVLLAEDNVFSIKWLIDSELRRIRSLALKALNEVGEDAAVEQLKHSLYVKPKKRETIVFVEEVKEKMAVEVQESILMSDPIISRLVDEGKAEGEANMLNRLLASNAITREQYDAFIGTVTQ